MEHYCTDYSGKAIYLTFGSFNSATQYGGFQTARAAHIIIMAQLRKIDPTLVSVYYIYQLASMYYAQWLKVLYPFLIVLQHGSKIQSERNRHRKTARLSRRGDEGG